MLSADHIGDRNFDVTANVATVNIFVIRGRKWISKLKFLFNLYSKSFKEIN